MTAFTRDLAAELERCLTLLVEQEEVRARIRVVNVDALANEIVQAERGGAPLKLVFDQKEITARWTRIAQRLGIDFTDVFLDQEWRQIVLAQALTEPEEYLKAPRTGRGTALPPLKRLQVWRAVSAFEGQLRQAGEWTFLQVCAEAARVLDGREHRPYHHVVIDEAQDLHPAQWRFLRALVAPGQGDLFLAGDTYQRIYGNRVSLRSLGVQVVGRSHRLRINYRTTQEILAWSASLLTGEEPDDMDAWNETLAGYRSTMHGERPETAGYATKPEEIEALVARVRDWTGTGVRAEDIGVAVRFVQLGRDIAQALEQAGVAACVLGAGRGGIGVRIGTMHRMKGLEFRCVAVAGVNEGTVPMKSAVTAVEVDAQQHQEDLNGELNLLFVACTRAREALRVSWHGAPSPFLAPVVNPGP